MSSAVWHICEPKMCPLSQKSPVFSCDSALKTVREPSARISPKPKLPPAWLPCPPPPKMASDLPPCASTTARRRSAISAMAVSQGMAS